MSDTAFRVEDGIVVVGTANVEGVLNVTGNAAFQQNVTIQGSLTVTGNLIYSGVATGNLVPAVDGDNLGNTTNRWDMFAGNVVVYGEAMPSANGKALGNSTAMWAVTASTIAVTNAATFANTITVTGFANVANTLQVTGAATLANTLTVTGFANVANTLQVAGVSTFGNNISISGNVTARNITLGNTTFQSTTTTVVDTTPVLVDTFPKATYSMCKYLVSVKDQTTVVHAIEILVTHDGTDVFSTQYGEIFNTNCGSFDAAINNANVELTFTSSGASVGNNHIVKVTKILQ